MTIEDLQDLTELRLHIEIDALRRSIRAGNEAWRERLAAAYAELSGVEQPLKAADRKRWEVLNTRFHEVLVSGHGSPWTGHTLRLLSRHGERYRRCSIALGHTGRDVHAEHQQIYQAAMAGQEARAALALEAHVRATPDLLIEAWRSGVKVFG